MRTRRYLSVLLVAAGCGGAARASVKQHPFPDNGWVGVVEYAEREKDPTKITNPNALEKAGRECNGSFKILASHPVDLRLLVYAIEVDRRDLTSMKFQCLEPERAKERCRQLEGMAQSACYRRMDLQKF